MMMVMILVNIFPSIRFIVCVITLFHGLLYVYSMVSDVFLIIVSSPKFHSISTISSCVTLYVCVSNSILLFISLLIVLLLSIEPFPFSIPIVNNPIPTNVQLLYHFTITGFSQEYMNILLKFSLAVFFIVIFSLGNIRSKVSNDPCIDAESVISLAVLPHTIFALGWITLSSLACLPTTTITCAFAILLLPWALASTLYILGDMNVCVIDSPFPCVPSQKFRIISPILPVLIALKLTVDGALPTILSIEMYTPI